VEEISSLAHQPKKLPSDNIGGDLRISDAQRNILSEDPVFFLISHLILTGRHASITGLRAQLKNQPAIAELVNDVIYKLESVDLIAVKGDKIHIPIGSVSLANDAENLKRILPRIFEITSDRILKDAYDGTLKEKRKAL
jgi:hypothetical protein